MEKLDKLAIILMILFIGSRLAFCMYILLKDNNVFQVVGGMLLLPLIVATFFEFLHTRMVNN